MSQVAAVQPTFKAFASFRRFTVAEYHELIRTGILSHGEPIELLEGWMVQKMTRGPSTTEVPTQ